MITKAVITEIISLKEVVVRIPLYNKMGGVADSTPDTELSHAFLCYPSGVVPNYSVGDVVYVIFEDNFLDKPVVVGKLKKDVEKSDGTSKPNVDCVNFSAEGTISLGKETTIGEIKYSNIECLKDVDANIKETFKDVSDDIAEINKILGLETTDSQVINNGIVNKVSSLESSVSILSQESKDTNSDISKLTTRVTTLESGSLTNPIVLSEDKSYGTTFPSKPKDGQLFFKLT